MRIFCTSISEYEYRISKELIVPYSVWLFSYRWYIANDVALPRYGHYKTTISAKLHIYSVEYLTGYAGGQCVLDAFLWHVDLEQRSLFLSWPCNAFYERILSVFKDWNDTFGDDRLFNKSGSLMMLLFFVFTNDSCLG